MNVKITAMNLRQEISENFVIGSWRRTSLSQGRGALWRNLEKAINRIHLPICMGAFDTDSNLDCDLDFDLNLDDDLDIDSDVMDMKHDMNTKMQSKGGESFQDFFGFDSDDEADLF